MPKGIYIPADQAAPLERRELTGLEDYQATVSGYIEAVPGSCHVERISWFIVRCALTFRGCWCPRGALAGGF